MRRHVTVDVVLEEEGPQLLVIPPRYHRRLRFLPRLLRFHLRFNRHGWHVTETVQEWVDVVNSCNIETD